MGRKKKEKDSKDIPTDIHIGQDIARRILALTAQATLQAGARILPRHIISGTLATYTDAQLVQAGIMAREREKEGKK